VKVGHVIFPPSEVTGVLGYENMQNMFALGPLNAKEDPQGVWGYDRQNNAIVRMKTPGKSTIGDIRVKYFIPSNGMEAMQERKLAGMLIEPGQHNPFK
jgi:hypothetical protein